MVLRELHGLWSTLHCCLSLAAWVWMRWRCRCCLLPLVLLSIAARRADAVPGTRSIFDPANTQPIRAMSQRLVYFAWLARYPFCPIPNLSLLLPHFHLANSNPTQAAAYPSDQGSRRGPTTATPPIAL
jgi:hypothetical protein